MLAEPEASVRGFLAKQLTSDGFDVLAFEQPDELPRAAEPDVVVLGDPARSTGAASGTAPSSCSAAPTPSERVRALEHCDDYLTRPFVYEELVARIRAVLRRRSPRGELVDLGELVVDRTARRVVVRGGEVQLATKEYALLLRIALDPDRVFTREQLLRDVWGYRTFVPTRSSSRTRHACAASSPRRGCPAGSSTCGAWGTSCGPRSSRTSIRCRRYSIHANCAAWMMNIVENTMRTTNHMRSLSRPDRPPASGIPRIRPTGR